MSHLRVHVPHPEYLFAMKCHAVRMGEEFQDFEDIKVLVRAIGIETLDEAETLLKRYYALDRDPARAQYVLEELLVS